MEYKYKGYVIKGSKGKGYCAFNGKTYVCADTLKIVKYKISIQISKGE